jgi:hypothetical protein
MMRRDASTKFGPGNKVGFLPSVTAGWLFLMKDFSENHLLLIS